MGLNVTQKLIGWHPADVMTAGSGIGLRIDRAYLCPARVPGGYAAYCQSLRAENPHDSGARQASSGGWTAGLA